MADLAERLAAARLDGTTIAVAAAERPGDAAAGHALQAAVAARLGPPSEAWKVGSTSAEAQARLGTSEPGAARVPARFRFQSGATVPVHAAHDLWIEGEFTLRLGADLPPRDRDYRLDEVAAAIDGVGLALEVVGSRLDTGLAAAGRFMVTGDGGANVALVTGPVSAVWREPPLPGRRLRLIRNDAGVTEGPASRALGDPLNVMLWLANRQRRHQGLVAGELVSTGTCTGLVRVAPGDILAARCAGLGTVEARLVAAEAGVGAAPTRA